MKEKKKAIIFDMDGTIVDNMLFHKQAWLSFLKKYNLSLSEEAFDTQNYGTLTEMIPRLFGTLPLERIIELGQEKELIYRNLYKNRIEEIKGLSSFLGKLKKEKIGIGLATMGDTPNIDLVLDAIQVRHFFDVIIGGHQVKKGKPDPEIFLRALSKLEVKSINAIAVEDSMGGINSALNAGLKVIGITTTHSKEELLDNGCFKTIDNYLALEIVF